MPFIVHWSEDAEEFLAKLPGQIAQRIVHKVDSIKHNPFHFLEHYEGNDFYKLRVGCYRLLVDVDLQEKIISIRVIGHRRNVYKG
jgi:mRNA interferase RelE/StbE